MEGHLAGAAVGVLLCKEYLVAKPEDELLTRTCQLNSPVRHLKLVFPLIPSTAAGSLRVLSKLVPGFRRYEATTLSHDPPAAPAACPSGSARPARRCCEQAASLRPGSAAGTPPPLGYAKM